MLFCHGGDTSRIGICHGPTSGPQALRSSLLGMCGSFISSFIGSFILLGLSSLNRVKYFWLFFFCRYLLCGWTLLPICIIMDMMISFLGTVERYALVKLMYSPNFFYYYLLSFMYKPIILG